MDTLNHLAASASAEPLLSGNILLMICGMLGILAHNLVEVTKLNRADSVNFKLIGYMKTEWPAILLNLVILVIALIAKSSIAKMEAISDYLFLGYFAIGYMGQSLLVFFIGKAQKVIDTSDKS